MEKRNSGEATKGFKVSKEFKEFIESMERWALPDSEVVKKVLEFQLTGDTEIRSEVVAASSGLIAKMVRKFFGVDPLLTEFDLYQEGVLGVMRAIELFNAAEYCRFDTYARFWVFKKMQRATRHWANTSLNFNKKCSKIEKLVNEFYLSFGRIPTVKEVRELTGYSDAIVENYFRFERDARVDFSPELAEDSTSVEEVALEKMEKVELVELVKQLIECLNENQKIIVKSYYGIGCKSRTFIEIAEELGVSKQAVCAANIKAIERMKRSGIARRLVEDFGFEF